ncbi:MAG: T9SS type A sorting domain-containing protein [Candidatus Hatepunaea meridiana]|nr:T9SS type A sorting domain-containing protein [Candidatus Hatepunaea meridiana]
MKQLLLLASVFILIGGTSHLNAQDRNAISQVSRLYNHWMSIRGFKCQGNYIYVATGYSGLQIMDVSDPDNFHPVGYFDDTPARVRAVGVHNGIACLIDDAYALLTVDISEPENPTLLGSAEIFDYAKNVFVTEQYAYVANNGASLRVFDISNPENPIEVSVYGGEGRSNISDVIVRDTLAFAKTEGYRIIDISDLDSMVSVGYMSLGDTSLFGLHLSGDIAICAGDEQIRFFDISDVTQPELVNSYAVEGEIWYFTADDDYAYVTNDRGVVVVDIRDWRAPEEVGLHEDNYKLRSITSNGHYVVTYSYSDYQPIWYKAINLIDVSEPSDPVALARDQYSGQLRAVAVKDDYVYLGGADDGLRIVDISDPESPEEISRIESNDYVMDIYTTEDFAFVSTDDGYYRIFDVSEADNPEELGHIRWHNYLKTCAVIDNLAICCEPAQILLFVDISDPNDPVIINSYNRNLSPTDLVVLDNLAYVSSHNRGLTILDISDPRDITEVGSIDANNYHSDFIGLQGDFAYLLSSDRWGGFVVDISNPEEPVEVSQIVLNYAKDLMISGDYAYVICRSNRNNGLYVFDISNPESVNEVGYYMTPGYASNLTVHDDLVYVADGSNLGIYNCAETVRIPRWVEVPEGASITVTERDTIDFDLMARDPNGRELSIELGGEELPDAVEFINHGDGRAYFHWQTGLHDAGEYEPVFYASNGELRNRFVLSLKVNDLDLPPLWSDYPREPVVGIEGDTLSFTLTAVDSSLDYLRMSMLQGELPDSAKFKDHRDGSGTFSWITESGDAGHYEPVFVVNDGDFTDTVTVVIEVYHPDAVGSGDDILPEEYCLSEGYPNPFNSTITIKYQIAETVAVRLQVFDISGRVIETLIAERRDAGDYTVNWDADERPAGIYFCRIEAGSFVKVRKMMLLK